MDGPRTPDDAGNWRDWSNRRCRGAKIINERDICPPGLWNLLSGIAFARTPQSCCPRHF